MAKKWRMIVDVALCQGCSSCVMACKDEYFDNAWPGYSAPQPKHGQSWMRVPCKERGRFPLLDIAYLPSPCMHCDHPPCAAASRGAITQRDDGIVLIDPQKARGRPELVDSCAWGAISWNDEQQVAQKCTFCAHLLDDGWKEPRCVQACALDALQVLKLDDDELQRLVESEGLDARAPGQATRVSVYYKNLHRYASCFIAGSVAVNDQGVIDCAAGVTVALRGAGAGEVVAEAVTDAFGDFKFDGLPPESGPYEVTVTGPDGPVRIPVDLQGESATVATITLTRGGAR